VTRALAPARILAAAVLAMAVLIWLGPLSSGAPAQNLEEEVHLPCLNKSGTAYKSRIEPKRCTHFGRNGEFAGGVDLHKLVWDGWGGTKIHGAGNECDFDADCDPVPVSVFAYRIRKRCGRLVYTRLSARSSFGTTTVKTQGCLGPA
jgi:hypothetical protein